MQGLSNDDSFDARLPSELSDSPGLSGIGLLDAGLSRSLNVGFIASLTVSNDRMAPMAA